MAMEKCVSTSLYLELEKQFNALRADRDALVHEMDDLKAAAADLYYGTPAEERMSIIWVKLGKALEEVDVEECVAALRAERDRLTQLCPGCRGKYHGFDECQTCRAEKAEAERDDYRAKVVLTAGGLADTLLQRDALQRDLKQLQIDALEVAGKYSAELETLREIVRNALASGGVTHPATRMLEKAMEEKP